MAQEFHISVTPLGEDEYLVRIERVAPGVPLAEEQVRWPVEDWLAQARQLMNDPLLGVLQGNASFVNDLLFLPQWNNEPVSQSSFNLVALGQELYNALFQGSLRDSWMMAQAIAQNQRQVLRLRLGMKGTRLPRLPWEVLHAGDRPLATGTDVAFSRYQLSTRLMTPVHGLPSTLHQPLKILMVISGPSDQETLELAQEASHLQEELKSRSPNEPPAIQLTILEQPGREQLTQALEQGQYQVFHYAGHSNLGESGGDVYLVSNKTGLTETLNGDDLAGLLVNNGVQLAVFNSCRGAYTATSDSQENGQERNLAEALVKRGIPSVLAMAERIPDEVALTLTRLLYRNLNLGYPIDLSLSRARQGLIAAYGSNQLYWALPVLYLHPEFDGFLTNTDDSAHNREELFTLPDPPDLPLSALQEDAPFFQPASVTSFLADDDELTRPFTGVDADYEDDDLGSYIDGINPDEPDNDDPSAFIQDLLRQLDTKPVTSNSNGVNVESPTPSPNSQPPVHRESPASSPSSNEVTKVPRADTNVNTAQPMNRENSVGVKAGWQKFRQIPRLWTVLGATSVLAIALLGLWFFQNQSKPNVGQLGQSTSLPNLPSDNLPGDVTKADTSLVSKAIEEFDKGNITEGQQAVEELLNQGKLRDAEAALKAVPNSQLDNPTVSFLRGRLAWQLVQAGNKDYDLSDARRYWETAHNNQPKSSAYLTALGFAYYSEGNYDRANQAWFDALYLTEAAQGTAGSPGQALNKEVLTIYAGLALGLQKSAQEQSADKRANLLNESRKLRQKVMKDAPADFQPDALGKLENWLWTEQAIQDWQSLVANNNK